LLNYVNDVAGRVHTELPQVKVEFLSYIHYTEPPKFAKPLPCVVPTYCEYRSRSQYHPIIDDRAANATCRRQLEQWVKIAHQATVYSYYADDVMKRFLYQPVPDVILADLRYYGQIGAAGNSVLMMNPQSWWAHGLDMYAYAKASWDLRTSVEDIYTSYFPSLYGRAADALREHDQAARDLFQLKFDHGETGEQMLTAFRIKKFDPTREKRGLDRFNEGIMRIKNCLASAKSTSSDPWVQKRIAILDQDAELIGCIYRIINESAGFAVDKKEDRKDTTRGLIARVGRNEVARKDDFRCNVLKSLMPHVTSVLGGEEAAKYDRVAYMPPE
jgi:hypothetical protein